LHCKTVLEVFQWLSLFAAAWEADVLPLNYARFIRDFNRSLPVGRFHKNIAHVLQTVIPFVLWSCVRRSLPLEDRSSGEVSLFIAVIGVRPRATGR
jgi:hypothetical protein